MPTRRRRAAEPGTPVRSRRAHAALRALAALGLALSQPSQGGAAVCSVPGTHTNLHFALADPGCTTIELAAQTYADSLRVTRAVTLAGAPAGGSILEGHLTATGASSVVALSDLVVQNSCAGDALRSESGARVTATDVSVVRSALLPCPNEPLFVDGFESGSSGSWSSTVG